MNALIIAIRPGPDATPDDLTALARELRRCPPTITHVSVSTPSGPVGDVLAVAYVPAGQPDARAVAARHADEAIDAAGCRGRWHRTSPPDSLG